MPFKIGNLTHFVLPFICLHFALSDTGVLNSLDVLVYMYIFRVPKRCLFIILWAIYFTFLYDRTINRYTSIKIFLA